MPNINEEFEWEDEVEVDSEFTLLEPGDYDFTVKKFERGTSRQGNKKAVLTLEVGDGNKKTTIINDISLLKTAEWKISEFFRSIGLKKHGEKIKMRWNDTVGLSGRCSVYIDNFNNKKKNKVERFLDPETNNTEAPW